MSLLHQNHSQQRCKPTLEGHRLVQRGLYYCYTFPRPPFCPLDAGSRNKWRLCCCYSFPRPFFCYFCSPDAGGRKFCTAPSPSDVARTSPSLAGSGEEGFPGGDGAAGAVAEGPGGSNEEAPENIEVMMGGVAVRALGHGVCVLRCSFVCVSSRPIVTLKVLLLDGTTADLSLLLLGLILAARASGVAGDTMLSIALEVGGPYLLPLCGPDSSIASPRLALWRLSVGCKGPGTFPVPLLGCRRATGTRLMTWPLPLP